MQKISTYLYPNRFELLADLAGFPVEYTNVYQRNIKIYNGIDNAIEFDIKNADQKRIDLSTLTGIEMHLMDVSGQALPNSPYTVTPLNQTTHKGLATVTIPFEDLEDLTDQFFSFSVNAIKNGRDVMLYGDTRFGAVGKMELVGSAMPTFRDTVEYTSFYSDLTGTNTIIQNQTNYHTSAIPVKFYEAVPTSNVTILVKPIGFVGTVNIEATVHATISVESFKDSVKATQVFDSPRDADIVFSNFPIGKYSYIRVTFIKSAGTIDKVIV